MIDVTVIAYTRQLAHRICIGPVVEIYNSRPSNNTDVDCHRQSTVEDDAGHKSSSTSGVNGVQSGEMCKVDDLFGFFVCRYWSGSGLLKVA